MFGRHQPLLAIDERGLTFDGSIRLVDTDENGRLKLNNEHCRELLNTAYNCADIRNCQLSAGVMPTIARAVGNWNTGERHLRREAEIAILQISLPEPARHDPSYVERMAKVQRKFGPKTLEDAAKYNPNWASQPRVPSGNHHDSGEFMTVGAHAGGATSKKPPAETRAQIDAKKQRYTDLHFRDAEWGAEQLHTTVDNILGLGAYESGWGKGRFATEGNNHFNLYAAAPGSIGSIKAQDSDSELAKFPNYRAGVASFVQLATPHVYGITDPMTFCTKLQDSGLFGIDPETGDKVLYFPNECAKTINNLPIFSGNQK